MNLCSGSYRFRVLALSKPPLFLFTHLPLTFWINAINILINNSFLPFKCLCTNQCSPIMLEFVANLVFDEKHSLLWYFCSVLTDITCDCHLVIYVFCPHLVDVMILFLFSVSVKISTVMASHSDYPGITLVQKSITSCEPDDFTSCKVFSWKLKYCFVVTVNYR